MWSSGRRTGVRSQESGANSFPRSAWERTPRTLCVPAVQWAYNSSMSRRESDREDLLREATALVERVELLVPGEGEPVVAGFRRDGSLSVFFGPEAVYQFNSAGELRRAFAGGL